MMATKPLRTSMYPIIIIEHLSLSLSLSTEEAVTVEYATAVLAHMTTEYSTKMTLNSLKVHQSLLPLIVVETEPNTQKFALTALRQLVELHNARCPIAEDGGKSTPSSLPSQSLPSTHCPLHPSPSPHLSLPLTVQPPPSSPHLSLGQLCRLSQLVVNCGIMIYARSNTLWFPHAGMTSLLSLLSSEYPIIQELALHTLISCTHDGECRVKLREASGLDTLVSFLGNKVRLNKNQSQL